MAQLSDIIGDGFVIEYCAVAERTADATYNSAVEMYGEVNFDFSIDGSSGERIGRGKRLATGYVINGATIEIEVGSGQLQALAEMFGYTVDTSGTEGNGNRTEKMNILAKSIPYVGLIAGVSDDEGLSYAAQVWAPKCKPTDDTIRAFMASGQLAPEYATTTLTFNAHPDSAYVIGAVSEVQQLDLGGATAGTYTLSYGTATTTALAFDADAATIQTALEALAGIAAGDVVVSIGADFDFTFASNLANKKISLIVLDATGLTGATDPAVTRTTTGDAGSDLIAFPLYNEEGTFPVLPPVL